MPLSSYSWPASITAGVTTGEINDTLGVYDRLAKIIAGWGHRGPAVASSTTSAALKETADYVCDGTADQTEINTAMATGLPVLLLPGTFSLSAPVIPPAGGSKLLQGSGWATTLKNNNSTNQYAIEFPSVSNDDMRGLVFRDFQIDCNGANQTTGGGGINARSARACDFIHLHIFHPAEVGLRLAGMGDGGFGFHNRAVDCLFAGTALSGTLNGQGVHVTNSDENEFRTCTFQFLGGPGTSSAHAWVTVDLNDFKGCVFVGGRSNAKGIRINDCHQNKVTGCTFDGVSGNNVDISGSKNNITGNLFSAIGDQGTVASSGVYLDFAAIENVVTSNVFMTSGTASKSRSFVRESGTGGAPRNTIKDNSFTIAAGGLTQTSLEIPAASLSIVSDNTTDLPINAQTGTTYTFQGLDAMRLTDLSNASAITATIPPSSSVAWKTGTRIRWKAGGAGQVTFTPGSGVTLNTRASRNKSAGQNAIGEIEKIATDTWVLTGDVTA